MTACCAQEGELSPEASAKRVRWTVATASDVEAAYESALAADHHDPGRDRAVITDGMILANVQAALSPVGWAVPAGCTVPINYCGLADAHQRDRDRHAAISSTVDAMTGWPGAAHARRGPRRHGRGPAQGA